jgi:hypothetical protein
MTIQYQMTIRQTLWVEQSRINTDYWASVAIDCST